MDNHLGKNLAYLREKREIVLREVFDIIGFKRTTWIGYEKGTSKPSFDDLLKIAEFFDISLSDLVEKDLEKDAHLKSLNGSSKKAELAHPIAHPTAHPISKKEVVTVDAKGEKRILYVPSQAQESYLHGYKDRKFLQNLPSFSIPGLTDHTYRMFENADIGMSPTIGPQDRVIARFTNDFAQIQDGRVYVVVTKSSILINRVMNRVEKRGKLVMKYDTIAHRSEFRTFEVNAEDVLELWFCWLKLSADFSDPSDVYSRINNLESDMAEIQGNLREILLAVGQLGKPGIKKLK